MGRRGWWGGGDVGNDVGDVGGDVGGVRLFLSQAL